MAVDETGVMLDQKEQAINELTLRLSDTENELSRVIEECNSLQAHAAEFADDGFRKSDVIQSQQVLTK